jgi:hypothetical protein
MASLVAAAGRSTVAPGKAIGLCPSGTDSGSPPSSRLHTRRMRQSESDPCWHHRADADTRHRVDYVCGKSTSQDSGLSHRHLAKLVAFAEPPTASGYDRHRQGHSASTLPALFPMSLRIGFRSASPRWNPSLVRQCRALWQLRVASGEGTCSD